MSFFGIKLSVPQILYLGPLSLCFLDIVNIVDCKNGQIFYSSFRKESLFLAYLGLGTHFG